MEIFKKMGETASKTYQYAAHKTTNFAKELKLKSLIDEDKEKIQDEYINIGKKIYSMYRIWQLEQGTDMAEKIADAAQNGETEPEEVQEKSYMVDIHKECKKECTRIHALAADANELKAELLQLQHLKQCERCHTHIEADSHYCSNCGHKQ